MEMYETDFLVETALWKSFCCAFPGNPAQYHIHVLPRHVKKRSLLFSASPDLPLSVLTPFFCRVYFCGLHSNTRETFLPVFPD